MALGILGAYGGLNKKEVPDCLFVGELSLDGGIRRVRGALHRVMSFQEEFMAFLKKNGITVDENIYEIDGRFRPFGASSRMAAVPTAYAVGSILFAASRLG
jgi:hypothetical protein